MKRLRIALGLAGVAGALCVGAAPAMAHQFIASRLPKPLSEAEPGKTKGVAIGSTELGGEARSQEFKFGIFQIYCSAKTSAKEINEGAVSWSMSQTFATEVKFEKCLTKIKIANFVAGVPTKFNVNSENKSEPVKFVYHVNGFVELGAGEAESEVEVGSGNANFSIGGRICKINWPRQVVPAYAVKPEGEFSAAVYSNEDVPVEEKQMKKFPSGFQQKLLIENEFKGMEWSFEEGQCLGEGGFEKEAPHTENKTGFYKGSLREEIGSANLGYE